jgi:predicted nuclease of predicted toxin-antitoxin system
MSVKILVDMNLSPDWVGVLARNGVSAVHWSAVGEPGAADRKIMEWAIANQCVVLTHDLDFGTVLALTHGTGPSVLQIRTGDVLPLHLEERIVTTIRRYETDLEAGALIVIDMTYFRVRILPL